MDNIQIWSIQYAGEGEVPERPPDFPTGASTGEFTGFPEVIVSSSAVTTGHVMSHPRACASHSTIVLPASAQGAQQAKAWQSVPIEPQSVGSVVSTPIMQVSMESTQSLLVVVRQASRARSVAAHCGDMSLFPETGANGANEAKGAILMLGAGALVGTAFAVIFEMGECGSCVRRM
jgi:hypothetical protein